jgi:hypothetical protein
MAPMARCIFGIACILGGLSPALADYSLRQPARRYYFVLSPDQIFAVNKESLTANFYGQCLVAPHDAFFYAHYIDSNTLCVGGADDVFRQRIALVQAAINRGQPILVEVDNRLHTLYMQPFDTTAEYQRYSTPNNGYYDTIDELKALKKFPISNADQFAVALKHLEEQQKPAFLQDQQSALKGRHESAMKALQNEILQLRSVNKKLRTILWIFAGLAATTVASYFGWRIRRRHGETLLLTE